MQRRLRNNITSLITIVTASLCLAACSETMPRSRFQDGLAGGVTGAAVGTGAGAIVGATTSGLADGTAIAVGAGSGAVVGVAAGLAYSAYAENEILEENDDAIRDNRLILNDRQAEIESVRRELEDDSESIRLDRARREYIYTGRSFGDPRR